MLNTLNMLNMLKHYIMISADSKIIPCDYFSSAAGLAELQIACLEQTPENISGYAALIAFPLLKTKHSAHLLTRRGQ